MTDPKKAVDHRLGPVAQAEEFVVTWLPSARSPEMRALLPLAMICSTMLLPSRVTRPAFVPGTRRSAIGSMPESPVPITAPDAQSTSLSAGRGRVSPPSVQASMAAIAA